MSTSALQLHGCMKRIAIEKRRNIKSTCCECCSHLIIICILVIGYGLSVVEDFGARKYTDIFVPIPPFSENDSISSETFFNIYANVTTGPLFVPNFDQYIILNEFLSSNLDSLGIYGELLLQTDLGRTYTNLLYKGDLHFAPSGDEVNSLIAYMNRTYQQFSTIDVYIHNTEKDGVNFILDNINNPALALIVLHQITPNKVNYEIRQNYTTLPNTNLIIDDEVIGLNQEYQSYFFSGFLSIEKAINDWAFEYTNATYTDTGSNPDSDPECTGPPEILIIPYPTVAYNQNPFYQSVGFLLGLAMVMSTMYPMSRLAKSIVEEKELKLKEIMKIMGLKDWIHQLSWFLSAFILFLWISISICIITISSFLPNSNPSILFSYFFLFCMSEITYTFFISVFFSNSKLAAIVAPVVLFSSIMPRYAFLNTNNNELVIQKIFTCLLPPAAFAFGADILASYEYTGVGLQYNNINKGEFNFNTILFMLCVDFILYGILAWYLDQVLPHEYGSTQPVFFFLNFRYWWPKSRPKTFSEENFIDSLQNMPEFYEENRSSTNIGNSSSSSTNTTTNASIEAIPATLRPYAHVRIRNLRKRYSDGTLAVRDFTLSMLEGQITCLLGHNGAGKTTTIAALTGMIEASSGDVSVYGRTLPYDLPAIRQMTGICPQHNVLYPCLTVLEHLFFFGNIKGMYGTRLRTAVEDIIMKVGLTEKRDTLSAALSGGMKRKLSLAIALIGDPKFLLLDEPTSGMDPYSRRSTWELLQKCKAGRVVLLTTHFMEEADTLADRIAIMSEGAIRCSGSSLFLKSRFGAGYLLSISKTQKDLSISPIKDMIQNVVPEATIASSIAGEVIFQMPLTTVPKFASLFVALRDSASQLGVGSYGISLTTLEQVFISLSKEARLDATGWDLDDHVGDWKYWVHSYVLSLWHSIYSYWCLSSSSLQQQRTIMPVQGDVEMSVAECYPNACEDNAEMSSAGGGARSARVDARTAEIEAKYAALDQSAEHDWDESIDPPATLIAPSAAESVPPSVVVAVPPAVAVSGLGTGDNLPTATSAFPGRDGVSRGTVLIQFIELYRKRLIIASRDMKGLFFQLIFPALQIALIMLILTIDVNPAGRTIILNANTFSSKADVTPVVPVAGSLQNDIYRSSLDSSAMILSPSSALNSSSLSDDLLDARQYIEDRLGAYVFGDSIPLTLQIDWTWVKTNLEILNTSIATIPGAERVINEFLEDNFSPLVLNVTDIASPTTLSLSEVDDFIVTAFNISLLEVFNITDTNITTGSVSGVAKIDLVYYTASANTITLVNVSLVLEGNTADLGNAVIAVGEFVEFLPEGSQTVTTSLPSRYTALHNTTSAHGAAMFYTELVETAFQRCSPSTTARPQFLVKNHPLPITTQQALEIQVILALLTALFILVPLCYIPASFVSFLVKERVSKSKHLQIVSSVSPYLYWTATYCWDSSLFLVLIGFIMIAFFLFGDAAEVFIHSNESTLSLFCLLVTYGLSAVPLSYLYSMVFENFSTAQIAIMVINFMTGFVMVLAYYIMVNVPSTKEEGYALVHFFRFFPPYNIGEGLINLGIQYYRNKIENENISYFDWHVTGRNIVFMLMEAVGYFLAVLLTEFPPLLQLGHWIQYQRVASIAAAPPPKHGIDTDVAEEAERVSHIPMESLIQHSNNHHETLPETEGSALDVVPSVHGHEAVQSVRAEPACALLIRELVKTYPPTLLGGVPKHAVRGVSVACNDGERFGLLGINGAGKTTILGILTGDLQPTAGSVYIGGKPLSDPLTMSMIGYCPQVDPLLDLMNAYETLWFFGRIRGIPEDILQQRIEELIGQVGLQRFASKPCGTYSGGNKRKLSLAVALVGDPRVLFLDEPSTGMDPEARRNMWTVIERLSAQRCVVLVSHSMEEVEALCTRMGVMVSGRLQCIGTAQHLKSRFGMGYQIEIRTVPAQVQACITLCEGVMSPVEVEEVHGGFVRLKVNNTVDLAAAFTVLEEQKTVLQIADYSISQCTLEQVFLNFAKNQEEETGPVEGVSTAQNIAPAGEHNIAAGTSDHAMQQSTTDSNDDVPVVADADIHRSSRIEEEEGLALTETQTVVSGVVPAVYANLSQEEEESKENGRKG